MSPIQSIEVSRHFSATQTSLELYYTCQSMKGLTLSTREQTRLTIMNLILDRKYPVKEAARLIGIGERHTWRLLAAYRREGAAALAHKNRGRLPWNSKDPNLLTEW